MEANTKNNLPWSVNQKLKDLDRELNEGILTEQGYEMKKKLIMDTLTPIQQQMVPDKPEKPLPSIEKNNFIKYDQKIKESNDVPMKQIPNKSSSRKASANLENSLSKPVSRKTSSQISRHTSTTEEMPKINKRNSSKVDSSSLSDIDKSSLEQLNEDSFGHLSELDIKETTLQIPETNKKPKSQNHSLKYETANDIQKEEDEDIEDLIDKQMKPFVTGPLSIKVTDEGSGTMMSSFSTIVAVLRFRAHLEQKSTSVSIVDQKGKEISSMNYERLNSRSEKVAQVLKERGTLKKGDCVALLYKSSEILEFMVALFGCFYAGMVAIPIITSSYNSFDEIKEIEDIFSHSNCKFGLTTDNSLKSFQSKTSQTNFPFQVSLPKIEWLKTVDLGVYHPKKKGVEEVININSNEIAYISYSKNYDYSLRGSLIDHKTIMNTCMNIKGVNKFTSSDIILSNIESRNNIGLMNNILFSVYNGNDVIFMSDTPSDSNNAWCNVVTKYKATISISSYSSLVNIANYINNSPPKKNPVDLSSLQTIIIPTHISYGDVNEYIENSLSPYGLQSSIISPMGMLTEYGGTIFCMKNRVLAKQNVKLLDLYINSQYMKCNKVKIVAQCTPGSQQPANTTRATELGFILPEVNVAIVNPANHSLCPSQTIGEIWISAPNYLPSKIINVNKQDEENVYHPTYYTRAQTATSKETNKYGIFSEALQEDYIPTGIMGFILEPTSSNENDMPRLFSIGLKKNIIKQLRTTAPVTISNTLPPELTKKKWVTHMSNHLIDTVLSQVPHIYATTTFVLPINNDFLPMLMIETDIGENDYKNLIGLVMKKLEEIQVYKLYCVTLSPPNSLPREQVFSNGVGVGTTFINSSNIISKFTGGNNTHTFKQRDLLFNKECHARFRSGNLNIQFFYVNPKIVKDIPEFNNANSIANRQKLMSKITSDHLQVICGKDCMPILEDHTQINLLEFKSILDIMIWRAKQYPKEMAYNTIDNKGREGRGITFTKLLTKVYSLAHILLKRKVFIQVIM